MLSDQAQFEVRSKGKPAQTGSKETREFHSRLQSRNAGDDQIGNQLQTKANYTAQQNQFQSAIHPPH